MVKSKLVRLPIKTGPTRGQWIGMTIGGAVCMLLMLGLMVSTTRLWTTLRHVQQESALVAGAPCGPALWPQLFPCAHSVVSEAGACVDLPLPDGTTCSVFGLHGRCSAGQCLVLSTDHA
jgi:hypothetical protein